MKPFMIALGCVVVMGVSVSYFDEIRNIFSNTEEVYKEDEEVLEENVEQEPSMPSEWQKEAQQAYEDVIRRKTLEAEKEALEAQIASTTKRVEEIDKELGLYWRDERNVIKLIKETFPEDPHTAVAVANCESGLNPKAYNPHNNDGSTDGGLWQINTVHDKSLARLGLDKFDPEDATKYARILYEKNGWRDWVCYTKNMLVMR